LGISDCRLPIRGSGGLECRGVECQTNPICRAFGLKMGHAMKTKPIAGDGESAGTARPTGCSAKRREVGATLCRREPGAGNVKQSQFARVLAAPGNPKHEARNPRQIRNATDRNRPECAKQTQFAPFWAKNEGRSENKASFCPGGARCEAPMLPPSASRRLPLPPGGWGRQRSSTRGLRGAGDVKQSQFAADFGFRAFRRGGPAAEMCLRFVGGWL